MDRDPRGPRISRLCPVKGMDSFESHSKLSSFSAYWYPCPCYWWWHTAPRISVNPVLRWWPPRAPPKSWIFVLYLSLIISRKKSGLPIPRLSNYEAGPHLVHASLSFYLISSSSLGNPILTQRKLVIVGTGNCFNNLVEISIFSITCSFLFLRCSLSRFWIPQTSQFNHSFFT